MKIYNKFVESKKEPENKSDIWFDGSSWKMYKEGMWRAFTLPLDAAERVTKMLEEFKLFKIVSFLPQVGENNIIYLVENVDSVEGNSLIEYIYINNKWEEIGKFTPEINLDDYAKKSDIVQSDYSQSDSAAKDYIKNRPFYENVILENYSEGYTIRIQLNYLSTVKIVVSDCYVGILPTMILNSSNNYTARVNGTDQYYEASLNTETLELIIQETNLLQLNIISVSQIKQLDEQYIPSTIARQSEITRLENRIAELENKLNEITITTNDEIN